MIRNSILIYFLAIALISCNQGEIVYTQKPYFDIPGFMDSVASVMQKGEFKIERGLSYGDETESITISEVNWAEELAIFDDLDINKPKYEQLLKFDTALHTGTKFVTITPSKKDMGIKSIVFELNLADEIKAISGQYSSENMLFSMNRKLRITFSDTREPIIEAMDISGSQKIIFKSAVDYHTKSVVDTVN
jgi:hypothetical protein